LLIPNLLQNKEKKTTAELAVANTELAKMKKKKIGS
jgi:hypothetical protein